MTYKQLYSVLIDPDTNPYFVGACEDVVNEILYDYDLDFEEFEQLPEDVKNKEIHDANHVKMQAAWYRVHLPKSDADLEAEAKAKAAAEKAKAEADAKAKAEEDRYNEGIEAVKADHELLEIYNSDPVVKIKIDNACRSCGAGVINSRYYFINLSNK